MNTLCDNSQFQSWSDLYFTQLFTTLGQLSAVLISTTVAVPVVSYYSKRLGLFKKRNPIPDSVYTKND
jgi:hypothetical protein